MTVNVGIWQPHSSYEVSAMKHTAGLYRAGVLEIWDDRQLTALLSRLGADLVVLEQDTHAVSLARFMHPTNPFYLVGPQNGSVPREIRDLGRIVQVETATRWPLQPSVAAAIVLHDYHITSIGALV